MRLISLSSTNRIFFSPHARISGCVWSEFTGKSVEFSVLRRPASNPNARCSSVGSAGYNCVRKTSSCNRPKRSARLAVIIRNRGFSKRSRSCSCQPTMRSGEPLLRTKIFWPLVGIFKAFKSHSATCVCTSTPCAVRYRLISSCSSAVSSAIQSIDTPEISTKFDGARRGSSGRKTETSVPTSCSLIN